MNIMEAEEKAREFLSGNVTLRPHTFKPGQFTFYDFDCTKHQQFHFFTYPLYDTPYLGGSYFVAVNKGTGEVHQLGFYGE
jgi:hypothetical protein